MDIGRDLIIVVGAGMAGLVAARRLQDAGREVLLLDKGRGVGGRMATRRIQGVRFDHGAQFFTVKDARFGRMVGQWQAQGLVSEWSRGFATDRGQMPADQHPRYKANQGMTSIPKAIAEGLNIQLQARVDFISKDDGGWLVQLESGETIKGQTLILTPPVPQSLALLEKGGVVLDEEMQRPLSDIRYHSCLALMALFDGPSKIPSPGGMYLSQGPLSWMGDSRQKGISDQGFGVTIHAGPAFSRDHWQTDKAEVAAEMLQAAETWLYGRPIDWQLHRWRYTGPVKPYPLPFIYVPGPSPLVFAGDAFGGPRVEGAFLSGWAAAGMLLESD